MCIVEYIEDLIKKGMAEKEGEEHKDIYSI